MCTDLVGKFTKLVHDKIRLYIGVNPPAIVREIPHFGFFPAFPHFCENIPHFWLDFETTKIGENRVNFRYTETFSSKKLCENVNDCVT